MDDKKKEKLFIILFSIGSFIVPTAIGLPLMLVFQRSALFEAPYAIAGVLVLFVALFRSRARDTGNYKKNHTMYEDHDTDSYKEYSRMQKLFYIVGLSLLVLSVAAFFIGTYALGFGQ